MKLLMMIVDEARKEQLEVLLNRAGVVGFTEIPRAAGVGATGPRLGSRTFPQTSAIIFTVIEDGAIEGLTAAIKESCRECGERLKMIVWGVEEVM